MNFLSTDGYTKEDLYRLQKSYTSKVIDIQRMKRFFEGSIGQRLVQFWIDAERYHRQVKTLLLLSLIHI